MKVHPLIRKYTLPLTGTEKTFIDHSKGFEHHIGGSNCYSYAMNHFETNQNRPNKTVPGDAFKMKMSKSHKFTDWQSCGNAIQRVLDDGTVVQKYYKLKKKIIKKGKEKIKCETGYRKICMVVETNAEPKGVPTDFHFYAQNKISVTDLYNMKRVVYPQSETPNIYHELGINAFSSSLHIKRMSDHKQNKKSKIEFLIKNRSEININLHVETIPKYMLDFIVDPWWILDLPQGRRSKQHVLKKVSILKSLFESKPLHKKVLNIAKEQALQNLKGKKLINKLAVIGIWSHKLGHATKPLNTDGDKKLIFHPGKANRNHGSNYDYDKVCQYFQVLSGWGTSDLVDI